jgi:hypothetical protein
VSRVSPSSIGNHYERACPTADSTSASFPTRIPTTTEPTGDGVIDLLAAAGGTRVVPTWLDIVPYGTTTADQTFKVRVVGWRKVGTLWVPTTLLEFTATLGTATGVSGATLGTTYLFADTVGDPATGKGAIGVDCQPTSPADNTVASYMVDTRGSAKVEILFDRNSSAASCNALVAQV